MEAYNDRGHAVAVACVDAAVRPGCAVYPKGLMNRHYKGGNFSELSHSKFDPYAVNSSFWDNCVELRRWVEEK